MTDVSGIPNLGFGGGPIFAGGYSPNINYTAQNNANLAYVNAVNQASLNANNLYGPGGFGAATDAYSAAGAAYGRGTGFYGDTLGLPPGAVTPAAQAAAGPSYGGYGGDQGPPADRSTLSDAMQQYYDAHEARYGYAPPASFFTGTGPLSWATMYGGGPAAATPGSPFQTATGNVGQSPGMSTGMGGFNNQPGDAVRSELTDAQQQYYDGHVARYGYAPPASFFASSNNGPLSWNVMYGGGGGGGGGAPLPPPGVPAQPFSPSGPTASQTTYADRGSLTPAQQQYYDGHVARYGYPPPADFFTRSGPLSWATMYGGGASASAEAATTAPPPGGSGIGPGSSGQVTGGGSASTDPGYSSLTPVQQQYYQAHIARYGVAPPMSFFTATGPLSWNTMYGGGGEPAPFQTATGNVGQSPGLATGYGGFNNQPGDAVRSDLTPVQQGYYDAHVARYGYAPPASFFASSNNGPLSWNQMYGGGAGGTALGGIGAGTNVGDFQQEAINQGQQSMLTLQDQIGAALNPTPPSDTLTDADRAAGAIPSSGPGSGIDAINTAAGIDPNTGQQYGVPAAGPGGALPFTGNPVNSPAPFNNPAISQISPSVSSDLSGVSPREQWLAEQRAQIATQLAGDPQDQMQIAARILTEDSNSPEGQQAVFEAILNNQLATGTDMFGPGYYPKAGTPEDQRYQQNLALIQSNPGLFGQMKEIMAKVFRGSNISNLATGWSQGGSPTAAGDLAAGHQTYSSPQTGADYNVFYQPTGGDRFGAGTVNSINNWLNGVPP